jgi:hypothetical protein
MPILAFDQNSGCSLPPFNPVSNRLFFFRINVFEMELPLEAGQPDDDDETGRAGWLPPGLCRLGLPITDLFPLLLPEYAPTLKRIDQRSYRMQRSVFLPGSKLNRKFSAGRLVKLSETDVANKRITVAGQQVPLGEPQWEVLAVGKPVSFILGDTVVRLVPPPAVSEPVGAPRRAFSFRSGRSGRPFGRVRDLSDSEFEALCQALFLDPDAGGFEWLRTLTGRERAHLVAAVRHDRRFRAFDEKRLGKNRSHPPRYEIGFISEYEQVWDLVGYSRGGLVSSLTLAPEEEFTIEVFSWDRSRLEQESSETTETERSVETSSLARVSAQLNSELTETTDRDANVGLGVPLPIGPVNVEASGQAGVSNSITQSIKSTVDTISETTRRASERFKSTTQVKVVQTRETGSETRVTRRIRNPNRGRTLTVHCFEVMEHYKITTKLLRAEKFVLLAEVPQPRRIDIYFVLAHEEKLQRALLGPTFLPGFAAAKKLLAQRYFDHRSEIKAEMEAAQAKARGDAAPAADPPVVSIAKNLRKKLDRMITLDLVAEIGTLANSYLPGNSIEQKEKAEAEEAIGIFNFWIKFKTVTPGVDSRAREFVDEIPREGSVEPQKAYEALSALTAGLDDEWLTTIKMIAASLVTTSLAFNLMPAFPWLAPVLLQFAMIENNLGVPSLIERAKQAGRAYEANLQQPPPPTDPNNDKGQKMMPPPQLFSMQELSLADAEFKKLVLHLEANRVYYMNSIFAQQDANVRYETLEALGIHTFVENRLLGFLGSRAVFPLRVENLEDEARDYLQKQLTDKLSTLLATVGPVTEDVSLPTNGLHMESVLGQCEALEPFLKDSRDIELALRRAQVDRAVAAAEVERAEAARLKARLTTNPPLLDNPYESPNSDAENGG